MFTITRALPGQPPEPRHRPTTGDEPAGIESGSGATTHSWARRSIVARLLLVLGVCVAALVVHAAPAAAADTAYCQILVNPHSACADNRVVFVSGVKYVENHARYPGSGTIRICEHTYFWDGVKWVTLSRTCGSSNSHTSVTSGSKLYRDYGRGYYLLFTVGNDSDHRHTINGHAYNY